MFVGIAFLQSAPPQAGLQEVFARERSPMGRQQVLDLGCFQGWENGPHISGGRDDANLRDLMRSAGGGRIDTHGCDLVLLAAVSALADISRTQVCAKARRISQPGVQG